MSRRTRTAVVDDDDNSQKENTPIDGQPSRVKPERTRGKPPQEANERDAEADATQDPAEDEEDGKDDGDDDDDDDDDDEENGEASPRGRKRARLSEQGDATVKDERANGKGKERPITQPRDEDGYVPGSIVRIALKNFVTYDEVEFFPGPYMNMILGPNGTGKSSIACAICLGLNFPPSVLGRATNLNSFVKHGYQAGYIEIELKGPKGKKNLVIRRNLNNAKNASTFTLNGTSVAAKVVDQQLAALNIQVGNLCSFLPQDKVSEFAAMTPQQLLKETERAAGDEHLTQWHETLISSGKTLTKVQEGLTTQRTDLQTLKDRNALLEKDVKKFQERRKIERQIELLELILPFMQYRELVDIYSEIKKTFDAQKDIVAGLEKTNKPIIEFQEKLDREQKDVSKAREGKKAASRKKFETMGKKFTESDELEKQAIELGEKINTLKREEKERLTRIQNGEKKVAELERELANPPPMEDLTEVEQMMREARNESNTLKTKQESLQARQAENIDKESRFTIEVRKWTNDLQQLDNINHQKLHKLRQWDPDCADAVLWLRNNKGLFSQEVFEPPIISVAVPNTAHTAAVEACFNANQMKSFVFQNDDDMRTFNRKVNDSTEALGKRVRVSTSYHPVQPLAPPPMSPEQLQQYGFTGYALDLISYPPGMRFWLMRETNVHRTPIHIGRNRVDTRPIIDAISASGGGNFVANNTMNQVTRSRYGNRLAQTMQRGVRQARNFVNVTVDQQVKRELNGRIAEAQANLEEVAAEAKTLADEEKEFNKEYTAVQKTYNSLVARRKKVTDIQKLRAAIPPNIAASKKRLEELKSAPSADKQRANLKRQIVALVKRRAEIVKQFTGLVRAAMKDQEDATRLHLQWLQLAANRAAIEAMCQEHTAVLEQAKEKLGELAERAFVAKTEAKKKLNESKARLAELDDELRDTFQTMEQDGTAQDKSSEEIQEELASERAKLELNMATNPGVVEKYEARQREIAKLEGEIEDQEEKEEKLQNKINIARESWEPALRTLVGSIGEKFSAAFDRFGCAGEVRISPNEDYEKWTVDILVKFRSTEKLQLLTAQRQSGGERALTTIIYLMSLTEQARAPFSLVDEINQGMDQRAERLVHNQLVEVTCQADSGQYFLITPKLLPNLRYHEKMRILCVNNGEWLPDEKVKGSLLNMIENYVGKSASALHHRN